jgi:hypothetical protein
MILTPIKWMIKKPKPKSFIDIFFILLRGIQLTHVQRYRGSTVKNVLSCKIFTWKGQSHEKFGEMRVWGVSLGHN